jgi:hypothetical protein
MRATFLKEFWIGLKGRQHLGRKFGRVRPARLPALEGIKTDAQHLCHFILCHVKLRADRLHVSQRIALCAGGRCSALFDLNGFF